MTHFTSERAPSPQERLRARAPSVPRAATEGSCPAPPRTAPHRLQQRLDDILEVGRHGGRLAAVVKAGRQLAHRVAHLGGREGGGEESEVSGVRED